MGLFSYANRKNIHTSQIFFYNCVFFRLIYIFVFWFPISTMHQHTDTDDLTPTEYQVLGIASNFLLPNRQCVNVQAVAYNPFKYIPLSRTNRLVYAPMQLQAGSTNNTLGTNSTDERKISGIPRASSHLIWLDASIPLKTSVIKNPRDAQRQFVSRGTMTRPTTHDPSNQLPLKTESNAKLKRNKRSGKSYTRPIDKEVKSKNELSCAL